MMSRIHITRTLLILALSFVTSHHILLLPVNMRSRYSSFGPLAQALLKKGHEVTMVIGAKMAVPDDLVNSKVTFLFYEMMGTPMAESQGLGEMLYNVKPEGLKPAEILSNVVKVTMKSYYL